MLILLSASIATSAVLHLRAEHHKNQTRIYLFKPLTTILIILLALLGDNPPTQFYKWAIVAGLIFSLFGDIFLMLPGDKFLPGLISFLIAHLCYIAAFASPASTGTASEVLVTEPAPVAELVETLPFFLYGAAVYTYLYPGLGKMKLPALIYMLAIIPMAWQALGLWQQTAETPALLAFLGALLFVASDSILAVNRFRRPFSAAQLLIMSTYVTAQYLIVLSI